MTSVDPQFLMVLPDDIAHVGAMGACILALVRYVTSLPGETNGRRLVDGAMWWRASQADIGQSLGGVHRKTILRALVKLQNAGYLLAMPTQDFYGDRAQAYRASDQPLDESGLGPDLPLDESGPSIGRKWPSSWDGNGQAAETETANLPIPEELEEGEREGARRDASEPLDVEAVPDPGTALSPMSFSDEKNTIELPDAEIFDGEIVNDQPRLEDDDEKPDRYCPSHMPRGSKGVACGGCRDARNNLKDWNSRQRNRDAVDLFAVAANAEHQAAAEKAKRPRYRCNYCRDTDIVLNGDGRPGSIKRLCHHDGSWHAMTPAELEAHTDLIGELQERTA